LQLHKHLNLQLSPVSSHCAAHRKPGTLGACGCQISVAMRFFEKVGLGALAVTAGVNAQDVFEPVDFNVTEALIENGVNVSAIPDLAGLVVRSSLKGCSIAV
jgi:hypothetical protein